MFRHEPFRSASSLSIRVPRKNHHGCLWIVVCSGSIVVTTLDSGPGGPGFESRVGANILWGSIGLHRAYPSHHPFGVVHWVPEQLNIKDVTGACKLIDGCSPRFIDTNRLGREAAGSDLIIAAWAGRDVTVRYDPAAAAESMNVCNWIPPISTYSY